MEDIRFGNVKGPGADEVALGLAFTSHGHLVIAMGLRDATSLAPAVRGSPRLLHSARPLLRELEQIRDEARCREQGGDECVEEGQVFTPAEASSILQLSGPCGVACDDAGHLLILDWER